MRAANFASIARLDDGGGKKEKNTAASLGFYGEGQSDEKCQQLLGLSTQATTCPREGERR